jgi:hypothetical protein
VVLKLADVNQTKDKPEDSPIVEEKYFSAADNDLSS